MRSQGAFRQKTVQIHHLTRLIVHQMEKFFIFLSMVAYKVLLGEIFFFKKEKKRFTSIYPGSVKN
jgi:hypothetical protein